ncbi:MAG: carbon-nitrogen family hydrolase [Eubacterium sp.]|nr:carbon-nitrogen family hydrolase [Eubacterium sp.]
MKVGICQFPIGYEEKEENYKNAEAYLKKAVEEGADLVLFPEMTFTGFSMNTEKTGEETMETVELMKSLARIYDVAIGFGWVKHKADSENHYTVVSGQGEILGDYIKIHPFGFAEEDKHFRKGQAIQFVRIGDWTLGLTICYDLRFPELYQRLAEDADCIVVAANWPEKRMEHWDVLLQARAIETQTYLLGINCTGRQEELSYVGHSKVIAPDGVVLVDCREESGLKFVELSKSVESYRKEFPIRNDRRKEFYQKFY